MLLQGWSLWWALTPAVWLWPVPLGQLRVALVASASVLCCAALGSEQSTIPQALPDPAGRGAIYGT